MTIESESNNEDSVRMKTNTMIDKVSALCALMACALCASQAEAQVNRQHAAGSLLANMARMFSPGVVRIEPTDGEIASFSGFFVGPGRCVTSRTMLMNAKQASLVLDTGDRFEIQKILSEDVQADLVLAYVDIPAKLQRGLRVSPLDPLIGEEIMLIGPPIDVKDEVTGESAPAHTVLESIVSSRQTKGQNTSLGVRNVAMTESTSALVGSPVLSIGGQVIGIVVRDSTSAEDVVNTVIAGVHIASLNETPGLSIADWVRGESLESVVRAAREAAKNAVRPAGFAAPPETFAGYQVVPCSIEQRTDTTNAVQELVLDGRFVLTGKGTEEEPYEVPWELLTSLQETFKPRNGRSEVPERITLLEGKWIKLSGFVSFPFVVDETDEMLLMLNTWDGCCLGVPPTPYDAIEVTLRDPVRNEDLYTTYAAVKGKLRSDPYLVGNWLVGVYVLDDAKMAPTGYGGVDN